MKISMCLVLLGCLALAAAFPAPREEGLQGLLTEIKDMVAGIEEQMEMEKRDQPDEDEDLEAEAEDLRELELKKRSVQEYVNCLNYCKDTRCAKGCEVLLR
ncbi:uncharacterized protein LOC144877032 [Branchiostoma floridae x Branchiostoma japonicum]